MRGLRSTKKYSTVIKKRDFKTPDLFKSDEWTHINDSMFKASYVSLVKRVDCMSLQL